MPIYQYDCQGCDRTVEILFRSRTNVADPVCPECGSTRLTRLVSRVARIRRSSERLDDIHIDEEIGRLDGKDEKSFARWARKMGDRFDGELGSDFRELAQKSESGMNPVERADVKFTLENRISRAKKSASSGDA